jgi:hypothetical protein
VSPASKRPALSLSRSTSYRAVVSRGS